MPVRECKVEFETKRRHALDRECGSVLDNPTLRQVCTSSCESYYDCTKDQEIISCNLYSE